MLLSFYQEIEDSQINPLRYKNRYIRYRSTYSGYNFQEQEEKNNTKIPW